MILTGIGSRSAPPNILDEFVELGKWCLKNKVTVWSGHADGPDWAIEQGAQERCVTFLPWESFNKNLVSRAKRVVVPPSVRYDQITERFHPNPGALTTYGKLLMNRNACQILGITLLSLTDVVVCWKKDGGPTGGTGQALRIAAHYKVPILNMYHDDLNTCDKVIERIGTTFDIAA